METQETLVAEFKAIAKANYNKKGWDMMTECFGTSDIIRFLTDFDITSVAKLKKQMALTVRLYREQEANCSWGE